MSDDYCCACGEPLEVVELLSFELSEVGAEHLCDGCEQEWGTSGFLEAS